MKEAISVFHILKEELIFDVAVTLATKIDIHQAKNLKKLYQEFSICENLKNKNGFNEFLLNIEKHIVKKIDEYQDETGLEFNLHTFQLLALVFKQEESKHDTLIFSAIMEKFGSIKLLNRTEFPFSTLELMVRD